jgi:hypothetical protein
MPITLAVDDELGTLLRYEAKRTGRSTTDVATSLLRAALEKPKTVAARPFRIQSHPGKFAPGIEPKKLNYLLAEQEVDVH